MTAETLGGVRRASGSTPIADLVDVALDAAGTRPTTVVVETRRSESVTWSAGRLDHAGATDSRLVTVQSVDERHGGAALGCATATVGSADEVVALVERAVAVAQAAPVSRDAAPLVTPAESAPTGTAWDDDGEVPPPADLVRRAVAALDAAGARAEGLSGLLAHVVDDVAVGSTTGLRVRDRRAHVDLEIGLGLEDRSAWHGSRRAPDAAEDEAAVVAGLARRLALPAGPAPSDLADLPVLLAPSAVAELLIAVYFELGAAPVLLGHSPFSGEEVLGREVASVPLTLASDPGHADVGCVPFVACHDSSFAWSAFDNGLHVPRTAWIEDGRLSSLVQSRFSVPMTGLPARPAGQNLVCTGGDERDLEAIAGDVGDCVVVHALWYNRVVDPSTLTLTGTTRHGTTLVRDGRPTALLDDLRYHVGVVGLLHQVLAAGRTVPTRAREAGETFPATAAPPLLVTGLGLEPVR